MGILSRKPRKILSLLRTAVVERRSAVKGMASLLAHGAALALFHHRQQTKSGQQRAASLYYLIGRGWQHNGNNRTAVSGWDTLIKGMWASHSRLPSPAWVLKMYLRANPALRIGGFHTPWYRAAFKQLGRKTHIFVLVVNPSSPGKNWFIFPPLSLLKVLFYSHLHSTSLFIVGM